MVAIKDMKMPKNCIECNHMDLQQAINCQLIYSGCANCGRHPNCPLVEIEERKVGKWIDKSHTSGCGIKFIASECTCCGKKTLFNCNELFFNYCPNCGCRMESGE